jgi:hypothetical protein
MKSSLLRSIAGCLAALFLSAGLAQAHPGHSIFDWTVAPHAGHTGEQVAFMIVLALAAVGCAGHWLATRKR